MTDLAFYERDFAAIAAGAQRSRTGSPTARTRMHRLASLGHMTGGIAHDFRNLLAVIESGLRLAERKADQPESVRAYIAAAREGINRGIDLTSQLLDFANNKELDVQARDLNELVRSSEPFLSYGAGPNIRVRLELGSDIPNCQIDPSLFDAAVLNLVFNARDAMPSDGEIRIVTERFDETDSTRGQPAPGTYARVRVKDRRLRHDAGNLAKSVGSFLHD